MSSFPWNKKLEQEKEAQVRTENKKIIQKCPPFSPIVGQGTTVSKALCVRVLGGHPRRGDCAARVRDNDVPCFHCEESLSHPQPNLMALSDGIAPHNYVLRICNAGNSMRLRMPRGIYFTALVPSRQMR